MNLSIGTPSFELALVPESGIERIAEKLDAPARVNGEDFFALIDEVKTTVYRCPSCGRIHVDEGNGLFNSFILETPGRQILS